MAASLWASAFVAIRHLGRELSPVPSLQVSRRLLARTCLDWTVRRAHLAGAAGAARCDRLLGVSRADLDPAATG